MQEDKIYGIHPILQILSTEPNRVIELFVADGKKDKRLNNILTKAQEFSIAIHKIDKKKLDKWFEGQNHQGVAAKIQLKETFSEAYLPELIEKTKKPLVLVLDGVQDPHNLGACLRTADACGVTAVIAPKDRSVGLTPVARKVSCGASETVPFVRVSNLARALKDLQLKGMWIVGTAADNEQTIYDVDLTGPIAIALGAEGTGLRQLTQKNCDYLVKIPMLGQVESLNVSVATGVCLYEAVRQRCAK